MDVENIVGDVGDQFLREELESCKHSLTDTEMENGNTKSSTLPCRPSTCLCSLTNWIMYSKKLKCAAKVNFAFGFVLENIDYGMCRYSYAHKNNTIMERSKLVCTQTDLTNLENRMQKVDFVDNCTREREREPIQSGNFTNLKV